MSQVQELLSTAAAHHRAGRLEQARELYQLALSQNPTDADAMHLLGLAEHQLGRHHQAIDLIVRAIALRPDAAEFHNSLGSAWRSVRRIGDAIDSFQRAIELRPDLASAYNNLGNALADEKSFDDAVAAYGYAIELQPDYAEAENNLGAAKARQEKFSEAVDHYKRAVQLRPEFAEANLNLGVALGRQGRTEEAIEALRQAISINPAHARAHSDLLYLMHYPGTFDAETIFREHLVWAERHAAPLQNAIRPHENDRDENRRLRVGYLSPDFMRHAVAFLIEPMLEAHDHQRCQIFCYSNVRDADEMTGRLRRHADVWRDVRAISDDALAAQIREDRIDVLVDLAGHSADNRALVMARKPAPVQMMHYGYPNTTGMQAMDYRITDSIADPPGMTERFYTERLLRLSNCAWCYCPADDCPAVNDLPAISRKHVTFGSLNNVIKINRSVVALWSQILRELPDSRLLFLLGADPGGQEYFEGLFADQGVPSERIEFVGRRSRNDYLRLFNEIDIALDPFPYSGHTTTIDSIWMGVPVVTFAGTTHVSRVSASLLTNIGISETIADSPEHYAQICTRLAQNPSLLSRMRRRLREQMRRSPVYDQVAFTRGLEQGYREAWIKWCRGGGQRSTHG